MLTQQSAAQYLTYKLIITRTSVNTFLLSIDSSKVLHGGGGGGGGGVQEHLHPPYFPPFLHRWNKFGSLE